MRHSNMHIIIVSDSILLFSLLYTSNFDENLFVIEMTLFKVMR